MSGPSIGDKALTAWQEMERLEEAERLKRVNEQMLEALKEAEAILTYCPQMSTNKGGKGPATTTGLALGKVRAAITAAEQDPSHE